MIHISDPTTSPRIQIILGSTRQGRICPKVAAWVAAIGREATGGIFELIDLRDWPLPMDDEPGIPATGAYATAHTLAWSRKVSESDAIAFVTPQYNWGYPAPLKNALDHLYAEWSGKPAMIVTYGSHGGGKCAGQLRQVAEGLKMRVVETMPGLKLPPALIEANDGALAPDREFADSVDTVKQAFAELTLELQRTAG